jgi:hypothetical protein
MGEKIKLEFKFRMAMAKRLLMSSLVDAQKNNFLFWTCHGQATFNVEGYLMNAWNFWKTKKLEHKVKFEMALVEQLSELRISWWMHK